MNIDFQDTKTVANGNAEIAYNVAGPTSGGAPTLCLIASTGRGPKDFAHLAGVLADQGIRVVLPWPRGIGRSSGPTKTIDFHDLANDAVAVLSAEAGTGQVYIVGHAYGCWIARTVAQDHPELIDGIILLAAGAGKWPEELSRAIEVAMSETEPESARLDALRMAFFAEGHDPRGWLRGWHPEAVQMQRAARARTDRESWWQSGQAPILDVVGLQDPFRPRDDLEFYAREFAPRVELRTVNGASHALPDERPAEVAMLICDWLRSRGAI